jgi:hypothetical protein
MDVFSAGAGNDTIAINASNIATLQRTGAGNRARVDLTDNNKPPCATGNSR